MDKKRDISWARTAVRRMLEQACAGKAAELAFMAAEMKRLAAKVKP